MYFNGAPLILATLITLTLCQLGNTAENLPLRILYSP